MIAGFLLNMSCKNATSSQTFSTTTSEQVDLVSVAFTTCCALTKWLLIFQQQMIQIEIKSHHNGSDSVI